MNLKHPPKLAHLKSIHPRHILINILIKKGKIIYKIIES
jgi:hypothetical protein